MPVPPWNSRVRPVKIGEPRYSKITWPLEIAPGKNMTPMQNRLALHTWTLDTTPLAEVVRAAKGAGWNAIELRRVDFTRCFEAGMTNAQVLDLVRLSGLKAACL